VTPSRRSRLPSHRSCAPSLVRRGWVLAALLSGALAAAQAYDGATRTVTVAPSGGDDTQALRAAFDTCAAVGPGCAVQVTEGTFTTGQHVIRGFQGTFAGAGMDATYVEPSTPLPMSGAEMVLERAPTDEEPWPILFLFIDADMTMRDLAFRVTPPEVSDTWRILGMELSVLATLVSIGGDRTSDDVTGFESVVADVWLTDTAEAATVRCVGAARLLDEGADAWTHCD
jgi:hypothetical protein